MKIKIEIKTIIIATCFINASSVYSADQTPTQLQMHAINQQATTAQKQLDPASIPIQSKIMTDGRHEITLCGSLPLSGEIGIFGKEIAEGLNLYFNKMKPKRNGLNFYYNLSIYDDHAEAFHVRKNIKNELKKNPAPIYIGLFGTDTVAAILPAIIARKILALFPFDGASTHRKPEYKNLIFFRPSFKEEINALVDYSVNRLSKKKIAIFYEASEWGESTLKDIKEVLASYNLTLVAAASYPQRTLNVTKAARKIADHDPDAIFCIAPSRPSYNFIQQIISSGLYKTTIFGLSTLMSIQNTIKESRGVTIITSSVVPNPNISFPKDPKKQKKYELIRKEFREDMKKYFPMTKKYSPLTFEAYIIAHLLVEATKLITFPITHEKIIKTLHSLQHINFKGLELMFDPTSNRLSHHIWINTGEDEEWLLSPTSQKTHEKISNDQKKLNL